METYSVKDLMVPISEYATVKVGTSLIDAIRALEKAQEAYSSTKYLHRAVLVLDHNDHVVGKLSQSRALKAIEPEYDFTAEIRRMKKFHFSDGYIAKLRDLYSSQGKIMTEEVLLQASSKKVEEFMQKPSVGEYVSVDCKLDTAIHRMVAGGHLSLLVTKDKNIIGILRLSDVFAAVFQEMIKLQA
ncbi:MAG: CBS domain-containing protein [Desulforhopalus sp.]